MSQLDKYTSRSGLSDSSDVDSDEEEARMDAFFGTASEVKVKGRKGDKERDAGVSGTADTDLQAEVESKRKKRPKLELGKEGLLSSTGLVSIHRTFSSKLTSLKGRGNEKAYAKNVSRLYREFANGLFGGLHWEDVLMRVEGAGGKEDVKNYLNMMRENERREGLEKRFGYEGAEKILRAMGMGNGTNELSGSMGKEGEGWVEGGEVEMSDGRRRQMEALLGTGDNENSENNEPESENVVVGVGGMKSPIANAVNSAKITPASEPQGGKRSERLQEKEADVGGGGEEGEEVGVEVRDDVSEAEADFDELEKEDEGEEEGEGEGEKESEGLDTQEPRMETEGTEE